MIFDLACPQGARRFARGFEWVVFVIVAIIAGAATGVVGAVPFFFTEKMEKGMRKKGKELTIGLLLLICVASLAFMSAMVLVFNAVLGSLVLQFAIATIVAFLASVAVYGCTRIVRYTK